MSKTINRNNLVLVAADHLQKISSILNCQDFPLPPVLRAPTVSVVVRGSKFRSRWKFSEFSEAEYIFASQDIQFGVDDATEFSHSSTPLL